MSDIRDVGVIPENQSGLTFAGQNYKFEDKDTLLGLNSPFGNLFEIELIESSNNNDLNDFPARNIKSIKIPNLGFNLMRSKLTRKFHVQEGSIIYYGDVNIGWMEDEEYSVIKFHEKWRSYYYNKEKDKMHWVTGIENKLISLKIKLFISSTSPLTKQGIPDESPLTVYVRNMSLPKNLPGLDLDYNKTEPIDYNLSYNAEEIEGAE